MREMQVTDINLSCLFGDIISTLIFILFQIFSMTLILFDLLIGVKMHHLFSNISIFEFAAPENSVPAIG